MHFKRCDKLPFTVDYNSCIGFFRIHILWFHPFVIVLFCIFHISGSHSSVNNLVLIRTSNELHISSNLTVGWQVVSGGNIQTSPVCVS